MEDKRKNLEIPTKLFTLHRVDSSSPCLLDGSSSPCLLDIHSYLIAVFPSCPEFLVIISGGGRSPGLTSSWPEPEVLVPFSDQVDIFCALGNLCSNPQGDSIITSLGDGTQDLGLHWQAGRRSAKLPWTSDTQILTVLPL
jgi:hypothetical protein